MTDEILGDRYLIQQQLGKKSGRRTFLARDLQTQELVVIKLLLFTSDFEWDDLKLFEREAQILQNLSHPAIPRYLNYFELADTYGKGFALVQTYIEAPSLESQLKAGRTFREVEVKQLATALLDILVYLHGQQPPVIHRDIKPSNILLTNRSGNSVGQVYLVDFGSVQTLAAKEGGTITVVGTYGYMPQEQFGGRTVPASDLYGLGATLIYVVTGVHPAELPQQDFRLQFEALTNLSPELTEWLQWMTEPRLEERLASASNALQSMRQGQKRDKRVLRSKQQDNSLKPTKPSNGRTVLVKKDEEQFEILLPQAGLGRSALILPFFAMSLGVTREFVAMVLATNGLLIGLILTFSFAVLFYVLFWPAFGRIRLHSDRQQIILTYEFLGLKYSRCPMRISSVTKLEYIPRTSRIYARRKVVEIKPRLIIYSETENYQLGDTHDGHHGGLTESEVEWIAWELSEWLSIPVKKNKVIFEDK